MCAKREFLQVRSLQFNCDSMYHNSCSDFSSIPSYKMPGNFDVNILYDVTILCHKKIWCVTNFGCCCFFYIYKTLPFSCIVNKIHKFK